MASRKMFGIPSEQSVSPISGIVKHRSVDGQLPPYITVMTKVVVLILHRLLGDSFIMCNAHFSTQVCHFFGEKRWGYLKSE